VATSVVYSRAAPVKGYPYWDCMHDSGRLSLHGQESQPGGRLFRSAGMVRFRDIPLSGLARPGGGVGAWPPAVTP